MSKSQDKRIALQEEIKKEKLRQFMLLSELQELTEDQDEYTKEA